MRISISGNSIKAIRCRGCLVVTALIAQRKGGLIWIFLSVLLQTAASVFGKQAALASYGSHPVALVLNIWYILELVAVFFQACCWIMALRKFSLSFAYPFMSLVLGLNLLSGWLFFDELITLNHLVGGVFISLGILLVNRRAGA